jgi:hypothetical protein
MKYAKVLKIIRRCREKFCEKPVLAAMGRMPQE